MTTSGTGLQDASVMLDWMPNTHHIGLYVAQAKGWYLSSKQWQPVLLILVSVTKKGRCSPEPKRSRLCRSQP